MRSSFRIGVGFALGCVLSVFAFAHAGVGHGSYTPLVANAPMLVFIPVLGVSLGEGERRTFDVVVPQP